MNQRIFKYISAFLFLSLLNSTVFAQLGKITFDMQKDKPEKFKTKVLKSETTGEKKFTIPRRFVQNTVSHYNYFFNANNKINQVIDRARRANIADYNSLLPYYSYSLESTKTQTSDLDSVILKATAGILLHDLRSDWVDNFYLLIGQAYYLRNDFDSAAMTFQFINYNLFPRKKKSSEQLVVGTSRNATSKEMSIASKEDRDLKDKILSRPPSRNDALIWQVRTLTEMGEYSDAAGLINTLKNDPNLPERLQSVLEEAEGYWFYKQQQYDSAISHIEKAMPTALDKDDLAWREYLLAQLYETKNAQDTASDYYDKAIKHTSNPLMDIYANLSKAKMLKNNDPDEIRRAIDRLRNMAKKYKFEPYLDIVFYSAAELAMDIPDSVAAVFYYKKSNSFNTTNISTKNKSFLALADISYAKKDYKNAYAFYDSLQLSDTTLKDIASIRQRKTALLQIVKHINIIEREDSLQAVALLSEKERTDYIKSLAKRLRKERGISDDDPNVNSNPFFDSKNQNADIFANNNAKGEWYFYNAAVKSSGFQDFKRIWGKRQNVDNWRRVAGSSQISTAPALARSKPSLDPNSPAKRPPSLMRPLTGDDPMTPINANDNPDETETIIAEPEIQQDISVEGLLANVPLTPPQMDSSNSKIAISLFQLGKNYQNLLEDYHAAIGSYEKSLTRFPDSLYNGELYMNLSYCYQKIGDVAKADKYKNLLLKKFADSKFSDYVLNPEKYNPNKKDPQATKRYEDVYNLFIEGNFDQALKEKESADSLYGKSFWSPQLLYIESVYYIRKKEDSIAILKLNDIMKDYASSPMAAKAETMIDVLKRRSSIENYLTNLKIERSKDEDELIVFDDTKVETKVQKQKEQAATIIPQNKPVKAEIPVINPEKILAAPIKNAAFTFDAFAPQNVIMIMTKVDPVYVNEAKNAFTRYAREKFYSSQLKLAKDTLDKDRNILIFSEFESADIAMKFVQKIRKDAKSEVSWLPADKYRFYIISTGNLELLKENKQLEDYLLLLNERYPGTF